MNWTEKLIEYSKKTPKTFGDIQQKAARFFEQKGLPAIKDEEWKYTNIRSLFEKNYAVNPVKSKVETDRFFGQFPFLKHGIVVFLHHGKTVDFPLKKLPPGLFIEAISQQHETEAFSTRFTRLASDEKDSLTALNTSCIQECLFISIAEKTEINTPVYLLSISSAAGPAMTFSRLLIHAGKHSKADITLMCVSENPETENFGNTVTEIFSGENSALEFNLIQQENAVSSAITATYARVDASARFRINTVTTGGNLTRNKLQITLSGSRSEAILNGLYLPSGKMHVDNLTSVIHAQPHCHSNQTYKGVISDMAHGVFNGRIMVERKAQKTQAYQSNKNLLLSRNAVINSKPQLEIFADDVKCTHGATTGQLDDDALFYLRARGINRNQALALLVQAFAGDVMDGMENQTLNNYLHEFITGHFATLPSEA
jgi:Fe-S cluster assembly protein SufD